MVDIVAVLVEYLSNVREAHGNVPADRPSEFITVELTGETADAWSSRPTVAIQAWSTSDAAAAELSLAVRAAMESFVFQKYIRRCSLNSRYRFDDPDSGQSRYQLVYDIVLQG